MRPLTTAFTLNGFLNTNRITLPTAWVAIIVLAGGLGFTPAAQAQHADLVLFGDANAQGTDLEPERKFVHPLTAAFAHEDSFVTSDVRGWFLYHDFPQNSAIDGGNIKAGALQLRLALTDTIQFVAYKDGYADFSSGAINDNGLIDIAAGVKFNFLQDWENDLHMAFGVGYEIKTGHGRILQNDDEWRLWFSANKGVDRLHLGGTFNLFLADDGDSGLGNSDRVSWHLHADYYLSETISPVVEINGYHTFDEGTEVLPFTGVDLANLGGGKSEDVVTMALGAEYRLSDSLATRAAYEWPLTHDDDLFGYRWTFSMVWSF